MKPYWETMSLKNNISFMFYVMQFCLLQHTWTFWYARLQNLSTMCTKSRRDLHKYIKPLSGMKALRLPSWWMGVQLHILFWGPLNKCNKLKQPITTHHRWWGTLRHHSHPEGGILACCSTELHADQDPAGPWIYNQPNNPIVPIRPLWSLLPLQMTLFSSTTAQTKQKNIWSH